MMIPLNYWILVESPWRTSFILILPSEIRNKLTKRVILDDLNRIFDPLVFLSPVLVCGKILLQQHYFSQIKAD